MWTVITSYAVILFPIDIIQKSNYKSSNLPIMMVAATISTLTDLGFLWFREFYLESSRVIQVLFVAFGTICMHCYWYLCDSINSCACYAASSLARIVSNWMFSSLDACGSRDWIRWWRPFGECSDAIWHL